MIKNNSVKESERIAKTLKLTLYKGRKALRFTQDGETKIALLAVKEASNSIAQRLSKNPDQAHNLRWVRNTERNKGILAGYLIKRVVVRILGAKGVFYYMPCCNSFSYHKPKEEQGHKNVNSDCLLLLLGEKGKSQVMAFKKQQSRQNKSISLNEFLKLLRPKFTLYLKNKSSLEWVGHFIEGLPQKDGCFQLPLIKNKPFETCPGSCPLFIVSNPLKFKVDLTIKGPDNQELKNQSPSISPSKKKQKSITKSSTKNRKKLKLEFMSETKDRPRPLSFNTLLQSRWSESDSSSHASEASNQKPHPKISSFEPTPATQMNFNLWSNQTANHKGPLFSENVLTGSNFFTPSPPPADHQIKNIVDKAVNGELNHSITAFDKTFISDESSILSHYSQPHDTKDQTEKEPQELNMEKLHQLMLKKHGLELKIKSTTEDITKTEERILEKKELVLKVTEEISQIEEQAKAIIEEEFEKTRKGGYSSGKKGSKKE